MPDNIILIGYRGSGKTTVANELGNMLGRPVISIDEKIKRMIGPINKSVSKHGWKEFREAESRVIRDMDADKAIIDCGGGVVESEENIRKLRKMGKVVWLRAEPGIIVQRMKQSHERPSITGTKSYLEEIDEVLDRRNPFYKKAADFEINTGNKSAKEVSEEIIQLTEK